MSTHDKWDMDAITQAIQSGDTLTALRQLREPLAQLLAHASQTLEATSDLDRVQMNDLILTIGAIVHLLVFRELTRFPF